MTSKEELDPEKSSQGELEEQQLPPEERKNKDALISEEGKGKNEQKSEEGKEHKSKEEQKVHKSREEDQPDVSKPETDDYDQSSPITVLESSSSSSESDGGGGGGSGSETSSSAEQSISPFGTGPDSHSLQWRSLISGLIMRRKRSMARLSTFPSDDSDQSSPRTMLEISSSSSESDGGGGGGGIGGIGSETSSSAEQSISPYGSGPDSHSLQWRSLISGLIMRRKRSMARLSTFPSAAPATRRSSSLRGALERIRSSKDRAGDGGVGGVTEEVKMAARPSWRSFAYEELAAATDGFSTDKLIGKGGHAEVYKGRLVDGQVVAVKRLMNKDKEEEERVGGFLSELGIIAHVNHPNAAQLLGFGVEGGLHLVLQFSPHGSLGSVLHGSNVGLDWKVRFKIAIGVAQGLHYLHEGCQRRIIHRDIKASNILLTEDFQPQISDFGLAKWLPENWDHHVVFPIEGTFGYLAPEYFMHGVVNEKTDVFAFGVLLLELITGRRAVDSSRQSLVIWAKPFLDANKVEELVDPSLEDSCNPNELSRALQVASMCIHHLSTSRPTMNEVVRLLHGEEGLVELVGRDSKHTVARPPMFDACDMDDYTCSRYLSDLHRHKQLALEQ